MDSGSVMTAIMKRIRKDDVNRKGPKGTQRLEGTVALWVPVQHTLRSLDALGGRLAKTSVLKLFSNKVLTYLVLSNSLSTTYNNNTYYY